MKWGCCIEDWQYDLYIFVFCFFAENNLKIYVINDPRRVMKKHPETSKFRSSNLPFSSCHLDNQHFDFQVRLGMGIALLGALNARRLACNLSWSTPVNPPICYGTMAIRNFPIMRRVGENLLLVGEVFFVGIFGMQSWGLTYLLVRKLMRQGSIDPEVVVWSLGWRCRVFLLEVGDTDVLDVPGSWCYQFSINITDWLDWGIRFKLNAFFLWMAFPRSYSMTALGVLILALPVTAAL